MKFGVFDHLDRDEQTLRDYYSARLQIIEAYDRLGFYAYHVAEHHATPLGMAPSPSVFLAAVTQPNCRLTRRCGRSSCSRSGSCRSWRSFRGARPDGA
jgi:hypothetical protein